MSDFRWIGESIDKLSPLPANDNWTLRWNARTAAVRAVLGETAEPGMVHSFSWKDSILPGACALTYRLDDDSFLYLTLGLTQPLRATDAAFPWEFCIRTRAQAEWPVDLLYQLTTQWLCENGDMGFGYHLPLKFFVGHDGRTWPSISEGDQHRQVVGTIRGLHLWTDSSGLRFPASSGDFSLLTVVGVTEDEDQLADETTPAHLMLLLRRMGVEQGCDPNRPSALLIPGAPEEWAGIRSMTHDDALSAFQRMV